MARKQNDTAGSCIYCKAPAAHLHMVRRSAMTRDADGRLLPMWEPVCETCFVARELLA